MPQRPMRRGFQNATDRSVGSRREESLRARSGFALPSACSNVGRRPKSGPPLHRRHSPTSGSGCWWSPHSAS